MADDSQYGEAGDAIRRRLWGDGAKGGVARSASLQRVAGDYFELVRQCCFGMIWARPNLALRDRSLITVVLLASMGRQEELAAHLRGALNVGLSKEELVEALMQVGIYAGFPMAAAVLRTAAPILDEGDVDSATDAGSL